jgi:hypothetical protein
MKFDFSSCEWLVDLVCKVERRTARRDDADIFDLICDEFQFQADILYALGFIYDNNFMVANNMAQSIGIDFVKQDGYVRFVRIEAKDTLCRGKHGVEQGRFAHLPCAHDDECLLSTLSGQSFRDDVFKYSFYLRKH